MFDGNVKSLKSRLEKLCTEKSQKERSMAIDSASIKDWGEVSDDDDDYDDVYLDKIYPLHVKRRLRSP
jgi:hypothetical protein